MMDAHKAATYGAFPNLPLVYDSLPLYNSRRDIGFYVTEAEAAEGSVLEIGCGTGRVLLPTARRGCSIDGLDSSRPMLDRCNTRLQLEEVAVRKRVSLHEADARNFETGKKYSLVTAPFRVLQHMITIEDQLSLLRSVARHLLPRGRLVFDVFNPNFSALIAAGGAAEREDTPETVLPDGRTVRRAGRVAGVRWTEQVSEVELIYYLSGAGAAPERHVQSFDMRWFLRAELEHLLARAGFNLVEIFGDFDRSPLLDGSPEQIVRAELREEAPA